MDTSTGIDPANSEDGSDDDDDDRAKWQRSPSPSSSVSHLAASFVQRVNDFVGGGRSPRSLTDAELEAEAERERDRSRREAEAILTREAQQRKLVEERVLAMLENTRSLPPPPSRSQTAPNPPSPANSQKSETSWWSAAKNKLTPTKEPLTPAQQIIREAKAREKERDKKGKGKARASTQRSGYAAPLPEQAPVFSAISLPTDIRSRLRSRRSGADAATAPAGPSLPAEADGAVSASVPVPSPPAKKRRVVHRKPKVEAEFEWPCPVASCGRIHVSVRIEGVWGPEKEVPTPRGAGKASVAWTEPRGAIAVFA